eukprot:GHVH01007421.1.p1 GENE.GHVH01007421.1~~GHVH01007421.1.p1  ORF type:complete len:356 (+),score=37.38 GHVH01007421.1:449-1516(+)
MLCGFFSGSFLGILEKLVKPARYGLDKSAETAHWTTRARVSSDMFYFRLMLMIIHFDVHHFTVCEESDESIPPTVSSESTPSRRSRPKLFQMVALSYRSLYEDRVNGTMSRNGTIVPTHISVFDAFVFASLSTSFVAFASFVPYIIKKYGELNQVIFFDLGKKNARETTKQAIRDHQLRAERDPINCAPLVVFPEGTSTTGRCIMPFKDGVFEALLPVQPVILIYSVNGDFMIKSFDTWSLATSGVIENVVLTLADWRSKNISVIWMCQMRPTSRETVEQYKNRVYVEMNLVLKAVQPNCLPNLPVWDQYSIPNTHHVKNIASRLRAEIYQSKTKNAGNPAQEGLLSNGGQPGDV